MRTLPGFVVSVLLLALAGCDSSSSTSSNSSGDGSQTQGGGTFQDHSGVAWNETVSYGTLTDSRDGQVYRTVVIGSQTWMAQNLAYKGSGSDTVGRCYKGSADSCAKYGRLYTWSALVAGSGEKGRGICPAGWHVPSNAEWDTLRAFIARDARVGDVYKVGRALKAAGGWGQDSAKDLFGFHGLQAGLYVETLYRLGQTNWWSSTSAIPGYYEVLTSGSDGFGSGMGSTVSASQYAFSARCLKD